MIEFAGINYYIDLDALDKIVTLKSSAVVETKTTNADDGVKELVTTETFKREGSDEKSIDLSKYEMLKYFIEVLIETDGIDDDSLGADRAFVKTELGYKITFNTLLRMGILKEEEAL